MDPIRLILVATDFSPTSQRATDYACELALKFGAKLDLVHALEVPMPSVSPYGVVTADGFFAEVRREAKRRLEEEHARIAAKGIEVESHLAEPPAPTAIDERAAALGADLIVIGTRGNAGIKHILLGSVAERTLRHAPCPVLSVK